MKSVFLSLLLLVGSGLQAQPTATNAENEIIDAYIYGFPLVLMDVTKDVLTATPSLTTQKSPINQLLSLRTFPDPSFTDVVSPNADTLYTQAWIDISKEPQLLSVPDMGTRYYLFPMLDEWTNVFFSPGTRTTGQGKDVFAITGPNWNGTLPSGVKEVKAPTNIVWLIGRIQTNGASDYAAVHKLQDQFKLTPLSAWGTNYVPPAKVPYDTHVDTKNSPAAQVLSLDGVDFFKKFAELVKSTPIPKQDTHYVAKFAQFGLTPGKSFDTTTLSPQQVGAINQAVKKAQEKLKMAAKDLSFATKVNGWSYIVKDIGNYGTNYLLRSVVALVGLGANLPEDAIYPATSVDSTGQPLSGKNNYIIHFKKGELPPVGAFWSFTMYNDHQFFIANPINRYAIGSRDQLKFNADGSLDIYIQHAQPSEDKVSNWLPAPEGHFNLILRLYEPKKEIISGTWKPPEVKKVN